MNKEIEIWKDVPDYEGFYKASNLGQIKSVERNAIFRNKYNGVYKEKILKGREDGHGYKKVALFKNGNRKDYRIHKIIAITFLNHIPKGMDYVVDHIDADKDNNNVINLQIITSRENCSKGWIGKKTSKYTGVYYCKFYNKWVAQITDNWKHRHLGKFNSEIEAHNKYQKALSDIEQIKKAKNL